MIKIKTQTVVVEKFQTTDGTIFDNLRDAEKYEATIFLKKILISPTSPNTASITKNQCIDVMFKYAKNIMNMYAKYPTLAGDETSPIPRPPYKPRKKVLKAPVDEPISEVNIPVKEEKIVPKASPNAKAFEFGKACIAIEKGEAVSDEQMMALIDKKFVNFENNRWSLTAHAKGYLNLYNRWMKTHPEIA